MQLIVLGTNSPYPKQGRSTLGYLVRAGGGGLLLDCGCGIYRRLQEEGLLDGLAGVVLSHLHYDHCADLPAVVLGATVGRGRAEPLPVFLPPGESPRLQQWLDACGFGFLSEYAAVDECSYDRALPLESTGMTLTMMQASHSLPAGILTVAAEGRRLVYTGDTGECPALPKAMAGADFLLAEACALAADVAAEKGHLPADRLGALARSAGVKRLAITHFMQGADPGALTRTASASFGREVETAWEGRIFEI